MDLDDSLLSDDLMDYVIPKPEAETAAMAKDAKNISLARMRIRQSIDQTHKNSVNHLTDPRAIYQSLVERYASSNKARLRQLIRMLYDISTQTNRTVQEKVDDLKRPQGSDHYPDKDIEIHEQLLICFLQMSMDDSVASSVYTVITAVISRLNTHCSTDSPQEYALNSTAVIFHLKNTYSVIQYNTV